jgi:hypothetical protein
MMTRRWRMRTPMVVCAILVAVAANRSGFTWATSEWDLSCVRFPSMGYFITVVVDSKMVIIAGTCKGENGNPVGAPPNLSTSSK